MQKAINKLGKKDLFNLIHSLTKSEKRYFKLFASIHEGDKHYIKVFDIIESLSEYSDEAIFEQIDDPKIKKNLHSVKHYLFDLILKSLRIYYHDKSIKYELQNNLIDVDILIEKGLYSIADLWIRRSEADSTKYYFLDLQYAFIQKFHNLEFTSRFTNTTSEDLDRFIKKRERIHSVLSEWDVLRNISSKIDFSSKKGDFFSVKSKTTLAQLMDKQEALATKGLLSKENMRLYHSNCFIFHSINLQEDYSKMLYHLSKLIELIEEEPHLIKVKPYRYLTMLFNKTTIYINSLDFSNAQSSIQKTFQQIEHYKKLLVGNEYENLICTCLSVELWTKVHYNYGPSITNNLSALEEWLKTYDKKINVQRKIVAYYTIGKVHFYTKAFRKAVVAFNKLTEFEYVNLGKDYFYSSKVMILLTHLELENFFLLSSLKSRTQKELEAFNFNYKSEKLVLEIINFVAGNYDKLRMVTDTLNAYLKSLTNLKANRNEKLFFNQTYFDLWLQSKIEKKPILELIQQLNKD